MTPEHFLLFADPLPEPTLLLADDGLILAGNRAFEERLGVSVAGLLGKRLAEVVIESPDHVSHYLQLCCRSRSLVPGAMRLRVNGSEELACRTEGSLISPKKDGAAAVLLVRLMPKVSAVGQFVALNRRIEDLGREVERRKKAEGETRQREEWLQVTLHSIGDGVVCTDAHGRVTMMNPVAEVLTGWTQNAAQGRSLEEVFSIINEQTRLPVSNPVDKVLRDGVVVGLANHTILVSRDGTERPIDDSAAPIRDKSGEMLGVVLIFRDVTESRRVEQELRSSEVRLRLALDAGRMGVWDWNVRSGDLKWSDSLEPLHGLAPGTFGGSMEHFTQLIHPDDREMVHTAIQRALESCGEYYVEFRNSRQHGGIHWIAGSGTVFPGDDGKPLRMIGIAQDVTQRRRAVQTAQFLADASAALAELTDFDTTLQKISSLAVPSFADWATVDVAEADGSLRRVSVSHAVPAKVQLAHDVHRRFPPDPAAPQGVWNILRTGNPEIVPEITDELLVQSVKDDDVLGMLRELGLKSYIGVPVTARGKTIGVITFINAESERRYDQTDLAVAQDVASRASIALENAQLYRELRDADQRKDQFLATLAHELRNPLAPIGYGLEVMRLAGSENRAMADTRCMMERQLNQMTRLVDDLLDVSRITRDKIVLRKQRVELATVVLSAMEATRPLIEQAGHAITVTLPPMPIYLDADMTRLAQVFSNLLTNSAKYTPSGGQISLTAERFANEVAVTVRDNGLGIPAESMPKIFEMFSQVEHNMERAQGGLGIGLTLVRRLVEMHGGTIAVRSDGPGQGSAFTVRLPVVESTQPAAAVQGEHGVAATGQRRILVVEDNEDSAMSLGMMLALMGHEIHTAHDGLAAVAAAQQFRPDLILLDIGLPKLNGYDACFRIRQQPWASGMAIVALTGWGQDEDRRRSKEAGFDQHLVKPVQPADLEKLLAAPAVPSPSMGKS